MGKLLLAVVAFVLVWFIVRSYRRAMDKRAESGERPREVPEDMVRCVRCGVHLPRSESILSGGRHYCGEEHRRQDQR